MTPSAVLLVYLNAAATGGIPLATFEAMHLCHAAHAIILPVRRAEWPAARMECQSLLAPLTSPRPVKRPVRSN